MKIRNLLACFCVLQAYGETNTFLFQLGIEENPFRISWPTHANYMYDLEQSPGVPKGKAGWASAGTFEGNGSTQSVLLVTVGLAAFFRVEEYRNPLQTPFYADPNSQARHYADIWERTRPLDAPMLEKIAREPQAKWVLGKTDDEDQIRRYASDAETAGAFPLFVLYNIPYRDCSGFSGGGAQGSLAYMDWLGRVILGIGESPAAVILEPDALAGLDCLSATNQTERYVLISQAIGRLALCSNIVCYVDAGHARWQPVSVMAARLKKVDAARAQGFSLNVSQFIGDAETVRYGNALSKATGGMHYVIDTSRNGLGPAPDGAWCNPPGRALGKQPTIDTGIRLLDAYLWVKRPGESDGSCNGGPAAGQFWPEYALGLAERASY